MSNLLYLLAAAVLSGIGCIIIWLRHRKPSGLEAGIEEFSRELKALAPDEQQRSQRGREPEGQAG